MQSQIRRIYRPFIGIGMITNSIGTLVIFALVTAMNIDVFLRNIFNAPVHGVVEVVIFSLVLIVFLQLPDVVRSNRLTRSDGFLVFAQTRFPAAGNFLARAIDLIACLFMAMIAWTIWPEVVESIESCHFITPPEFGAQPTGEFFTDLSSAFARCEYFGTPGIFTTPWWPAKLAIGYSVTMCSIIFLFKAVLGDTHQNVPGNHESPA